MTENEIGKLLVDSALAVHRELGPGLLETVYEVVLARDLRQRGLGVEKGVRNLFSRCLSCEVERAHDGIGKILLFNLAEGIGRTDVEGSEA